MNIRKISDETAVSMLPAKLAELDDDFLLSHIFEVEDLDIDLPVIHDDESFFSHDS